MRAIRLEITESQGSGCSRHLARGTCFLGCGGQLITKFWSTVRSMDAGAEHCDYINNLLAFEFQECTDRSCTTCKCDCEA